MSYHEKKALAGLVTLLLVVVGYCIYAFSSYANGNTQNDNIKFWAGAILLFIAVGVIITVFLHRLTAEQWPQKIIRIGIVGCP